MRSIKIISTLSIFLISQTPLSQPLPLQQNDLVYKFTPISQNCVNIQAEFLGNASGQTHLMVPWEFYTHLKKSISVNAESGELKAGSNFTKDNITMVHNPNVKIRVDYELCNDPSSNPRLPVFDNEFFSFYSLNTLVYPHINWVRPLTVVFDFSALPKTNKVFSSFGEGRIIKVNKKITDILFSQFVGGNINPSIITIENNPIYLVEHGQWSVFKDKSASSIIKEIIQYQRREMQDYDFPHYVVTLIKQPGETPAFSGNHTKNSLSLNFTEVPMDKSHRVLYVISHELFHSWLGSKMEIPFHLRNKYRWFFEGFTDYFALKMAKEGGFINADQHVDILNSRIQEYYSSACNKLPNSIYELTNKPSNDCFDFIPTRGHLLVLSFSELLKRKGLSEDTLKLFIKDLILASSQNDNQLTDEIFWKCFNRHFDHDFKRLLEKHIFDGEMIKPPSLNGFRLVATKVDKVDPGFDLIESLKNNKITKVKSASPAFKAGLAENADFKSFKILDDKNKNQMVVTVQSNEQIKQLAFNPKLVKTKSYQYMRIDDKGKT